MNAKGMLNSLLKRFSSGRDFPGPYSDLQNLEASLRLAAYEPRCAWPALYYGTTKKLVEWVQAKEVLEIGVAFGYHAKSLMGAASRPNYTGIDPYLAGYDPDDFFVQEVTRIFPGSSPQDSMDILFSEVDRSLRIGEGATVELFRGTSDEFRSASKNKTFDFIWIDGDHTFQGVLRDLEFSLEVIAEGGIIAGDDFDWPQVREAVTKFSADHQLAPFEVRNLNQGGHAVFVLECNAGSLDHSKT